MARAIHFGAGALGLGLTCWSCHKLGLNVVVFNRSSTSDARNNLLKLQRSFTIAYPTAPPELVPLEDFLYVPDELAHASSLIQSDETVLFTTALKEYGFRQMLPLIRELFLTRSKRRDLRPLLFIACENALNSTQCFDLLLEGLPDEDRSAITSAVVPVNSVVDRICNKPLIIDGKVTVFCEVFSKWYIEIDPLSVDTLGRKIGNGDLPVELVEAIYPYIVRKKWIVNALHLSSAIVAHANGHGYVHLALNEKKAFLLFLGVARELEIIFALWAKGENGGGCFSAKSVRRYCEETRVRILKHPQRVHEATTRLKKEMLLDFIKDFYRKVVGPFSFYVEETGEELYYIPLIMAQVNALIAEERFLD